MVIGMAKQKHLTKNELLRRVKNLQDLKRNTSRAPFTGMATLCNYVLWKEEKWYQKKLAEYNQRVAEYDRRLDDGEITIFSLRRRLKKCADFDVDYAPYTYADITVPKKKNSFLYQMEKQIVDANNEINDWSVRYILIHYNVLIDMGYGYKRLNRNKDQLNRWLGVGSQDEGMRIMDLHRELIEGVGIYIEMPKIGD